MVTAARSSVRVPVDDEDVVARLWRVDVGRVPLYLLDTDRAENSTVGRWITSRLYEGIRAVRLAQYGVLGFGAAQALEALGIEPSVFHINEGHPMLAMAALMARSAEQGRTYEEAWDAAAEPAGVHHPHPRRGRQRHLRPDRREQHARTDRARAREHPSDSSARRGSTSPTLIHRRA